MKLLTLCALVLFSTTTFARQYFQCSTVEAEYSDVMVLNLKTAQEGTLFLSSGMQNPEDERTLVDLELEKTENGNHIYRVVNEQRSGHVIIPSHVIGKSTDHVNVDLAFNGYGFRFSCFARMYHD